MENLIKKLKGIKNTLILKARWKLLGRKRMTAIVFRDVHGYPMNLKDPRTFMEKIQWIKFYGNVERFAPYVDKYTVREYVKRKIGEQHLIPLIGLYHKSSEIDFNALPRSFIIKATHGSGWLIIVEDKTAIDWKSAKATMDWWIRMNYYHVSYEINYKPLKGRIIIEEYIRDPGGDLKDYKFLCCGGEPRFVQVDSLRFSDHGRDFYDMEWKKVPITNVYKNLPEPAPKPEMLDEMIRISRFLSEDFPFVRVDLYCTNGRIYFGELTFTPHNGMEPIKPVEYDRIIGSYLDLSSYNNR